ncbi:MAG: TetR/AcrR family transcriptional regulator [Calditrichaeota bacterium]|nr:TetR/AcrR family transcriptional regulator [Calditrichota bacterium]
MKDLHEFEQNTKFQTVIRTSKDLFYRYGIRRVTIGEICQKANVSKMTFYKFFSNKMDLVKYLLNKIFDQGIADYNAIMAQHIPFREKVEKVIQLKMEQTESLSQEFLQELMQNPDPSIAEIMDVKRKQTFQIIMDSLVKAQKNGDLRKEIKPEFIMYMLNHLIEMTNDERLNAIFANPQEMSVELTSFFFYGILEKKK